MPCVALISDIHGNVDALEAVLADIAKQGVKDGITSATDIASEMGLSKGQVSKLAKKAIEAGRLRKEGNSYALPA